MTIYNKIRNFQESQRLELKEQLPDNLEKEAVAFLNASGGELIIGVQDNGAVVGVDNPDAVQLKIKDRLVNNVRPSILGLFEIKLENHNDKTIVVTTFASGVEKPYYIKQKGRSEAGCFIRVGAAAQPMSEEMIDNLLNIRYPVSLANLPARNQDLNFTQLQIYYNGKQKPLSEKFAKTLDFYTPDGKYNQVAAIFSDENNFSFRLAKWFGTDKIDLCQKEEYGFRCLITVIEKVLSRLDTENITFARKMGLQQRVEQQLINQNALREAVVNAFAHNDYSQGNTPIFEIFSNRIEITTYGNLLQWISEEDFFAGVSKPRNREIMRVLNDLDFVENIGSGIPFLVKTYGKDIFYFSNSISRISFFFEQGEKVEIPRKSRVKSREKSSVKSSVENNIQNSENKAVSNVYSSVKNRVESSVESSVKSSVKNRVESSEKSREKILMVIEANSDITIPELAYYLHLSTRAIEKTLKSLREENKICRVGAKKGGHWEVIN